jgi:hypothetical protein
MAILMIILRLVHILCGVFWAGGTFLMAGFVTPAVVATGPEGQKFMQQLGLRSQFSAWMGLMAVLTSLSGLLLYWAVSGFRLGWITSGYGLSMTVGGIAGLAAFGHGSSTQFRTTQKMKALARDMAAAGGPPKPEQIAQMQAMAASQARNGQVLTAILAVALVGMSAAQYVSF